jgi:hypothetical protein
VLVVLLIGVGIWQGWFKFAVNSDEKVTVEVDGRKVKADSQAAIEAGRQKLEDLKKTDDGKTGATGTAPKLVDTPGPFGGK